uniref:Uncharacterized protein n=1 Tax=Rhizophora mucronata TaxID=61149 RepID=A0A2P2PZM1_RHIMU
MNQYLWLQRRRRRTRTGHRYSKVFC